MTYAIILAAGIGQRFNKNIIKPLFCVNKKPIFLHSLDTFITNKSVDKILLVINQKYQNQYLKYLKQPRYSKVHYCFGNLDNRHLSLCNGINYLINNFNLKPQDIIVTHDAARINISSSLIDKNILTTKKHGYASTVFPLSDSICEMKMKMEYLNRENKYLVQTPQTFMFKYWKNKSVTSNNKVTDLFTYLQLPISKNNLVLGELLNFKITTKEDLVTVSQIQ